MKTTICLTFIILTFIFSSCIDKKIYSSSKEYSGVIVFEYKYLEDYERFWYNTTYFIDWESKKHFSPTERVPFYGDSCRSVLKELVDKEGQVDLNDSLYYRRYMASKSGFHLGGDIYQDTKDSTKLNIAFYLTIKGHLVYEYCEKYEDDYEEIPCDLGVGSIYPDLFIYDAKHLRKLRELELKELNFYLYKEDEFRVGYCE